MAAASDEKTVDLLSLHMGFYLASWGMMCKSTALLQYDCKVHVPAVRAVLKHHVLYGQGLDALCEQKAALAGLCDDITAAYTDEENQLRQFESVSDILVSKVILGTLGITPAYDRNVKQAVKAYDISADTFSPKSFRMLAHYFAEKHADTTARMTKEMQKLCPYYTRVKVINGILWVLGRNVGAKA